MSKPSPRSMRIAYQLWALATPLGWDITMAEAAAALGVDPSSVINIARAKGWMGRFRANPNTPATGEQAPIFRTHITSVDRALEALQ